MKWQTRTLGNLVQDGGGGIQTGPFGSQLHQSDYSDSGTPVVMPQDIADDRISVEKIAYVPDQVANKLVRHRLECGDVVYPRRGDLNKRVIIRDGEAGWLCGTGCIRVRLGDSEVDPGFLYYYLRLPHVVRFIENKAIGATMLNLNTSILESVSIAYPPKVEQQRIASILSAYDDLIENNTRRISLLDELVRLVFREWFLSFRFPGHERTRIVNGIPDGWEATTLGSLVDLVRGAVDPAQVDPSTPYVGLEHIPRQSIALNAWGEAADVGSNKFRFEELDILFGKIRPYFHKVVFAPMKGICSSDTIVMRPRRDCAFGIALAVASSARFVDHVWQAARIGAKMPRADWGVMASYPVLMPGPALLEEFNDLVLTAAREIQSLIVLNQKLREARDLLLPRLMDGRIPV